MTRPRRLPFALRVLQRLEFPHKLGTCERIFGRSLAGRNTCWVQTAAGIPWKLDLRNSTLRWIVYGKYEGAAFLDWAKRILPTDGVVVDSGANIGQMLLYLAQWVPDGRVLAFEPGAHQADWLAECLDVNSHLPVELIRFGLGERTHDAFLKECGAADRHGSWNQVSDIDGEAIHITRLDEMLEQRGVSRVHLWKLDVEGHEIPALQGAGRFVDEHRIDAIYAECAGENGLRIREYLQQRGYRCFLFTRAGRLVRAHDLPEHTNGLFLPEKR